MLFSGQEIASYPKPSNFEVKVNLKPETQVPLRLGRNGTKKTFNIEVKSNLNFIIMRLESPITPKQYANKKSLKHFPIPLSFVT